jgi:hypothetical protein
VAHARHEDVRRRYGFRCGYCGVSEADTGGELTVDHHQPVVAGGDDRDENLVYACFRCNLYKGDFFPNEGDLARGHRVLHPLQEDMAAHLRLNELSGLLEPRSETGRFHITLLRLNRRTLVRHRIQSRMIALLAMTQELLAAENAQLRATLTAQENYIAQLLGLPPHEPSPEQHPE